MTVGVSILLLTKDGAAHLPALLDALDRQELDVARETVAVDSGSTDGTLELLRGRVDRVERIAPEDFDHARTRNLGVSLCAGELVVLLVQDALPSSTRWLAELTAPLRADPRVAGTFARQRARDDASAVTRRQLSRWVATRDEPRRVSLDDPTSWQTMSPAERHLACAFDDVCACVRRDVWRAHPFPPTPIAEDVAWAREVLLAGWSLAYCPAAEVVHSHERSAGYELARTYLVHRELRRLFGLTTIPGPGRLVVAIAATLREHVACVAAGPRGPGPLAGELARAVALAVAWPLGQFLGARAADRRWPTVRIPGV